MDEIVITAINEKNLVKITTQAESTRVQPLASLRRYTNKINPASQPMAGIKETTETAKIISAISFSSILTKLNFVASHMHSDEINTSRAKAMAIRPIRIPCEI